MSLYLAADPRLMSDGDILAETRTVIAMSSRPSQPATAVFNGHSTALRISLLGLRYQFIIVALAIRRGKRPDPDPALLSVLHTKALMKYAEQTLAYEQMRVRYMDEWFQALAVRCRFPIEYADDATPWGEAGLTLAEYREDHGLNPSFWWGE